MESAVRHNGEAHNFTKQLFSQATYKNNITMQDIGYETVSCVLESWDAARRARKDDFEKTFGSLMIKK